MRKVAFGLGYAGSILALIFSLLMVFTVPAGLAFGIISDIQDDMENENVLAFNEVALALMDEPVADYSEENMAVFAQEVAQNSAVVGDADVYEDTVGFVYDIGRHGVLSMLVVGVAVAFALIAFIGALISQKAPAGGGVVMLIAALVTLLASIYTDTLVPMIISSLLLTAAGLAAFAASRAYDVYDHAQYVQTYSQTPRSRYEKRLPSKNTDTALPEKADSDNEDELPFPEAGIQGFRKLAETDNLKET